MAENCFTPGKALKSAGLCRMGYIVCVHNTQGIPSFPPHLFHCIAPLLPIAHNCTPLSITGLVQATLIT